MACCPGPCQATEDALARLLCPELTHMMAALEVLSGLAQENKSELVERILQGPKREDYISLLRQLLRSTDPWLCSVAAYLLGVLMEREDFVLELQLGTPSRSKELVSALGELLMKEDPDIVMHAAGAVASLAESSAGREWLMQDVNIFREVLSHLSTLLGQERESTVNSAALTLARVSLCERACRCLLFHPCARSTLTRLLQCLAHSHTDTAMNAAFAVGRLCGSEEGRSLILDLAQEHGLVGSLQSLLCNGTGPGAGQTACFALSCLATEADGHALVLESPAFPHLLDNLHARLLDEEQDSAWFAAMTVKVLVMRPSGVLRVREHKLLEERLQALSSWPSIGKELREEVSTCLKKLHRLPKPLPPTTRRRPSGSFVVSWEKCVPESGLEVTYSLLDKDKLLYRGTQCHLNLPLSALQSEPTHSLRLIQSTADDDISPCSEPTLLAVEKEGPVFKLGPPLQLRVIGFTPTQVRLSWAAPEGGLKPRTYQLYRDETMLDTTTEQGAIVGGLSPGTRYRLGVSAIGPGEVMGKRAEVEAQTVEDQDHAPSGLTVTVLGRHELLVSWGAPVLPLGRLFNYELRLNGQVAYLGVERAYTARRLAANTAYTCTVTAITSRGRCESRPVTRRTARDEYLHTQRCLYSPSRLPAPQIPAPPPPPVKEGTEVREKVKKSRSPQGHLPKVQLSLHRDRQANNDRDLRRWSSVSVPSSDCESSRTLSQCAEVVMGTVSGYDVNSLWRRAREKASVGICQTSAKTSPFLPRRSKTEGDPQPHQDVLHTPGPVPQRAKSGTGTAPSFRDGLLLQLNVPGGVSRERGNLPPMAQRISGVVKWVQPTPNVWSEMDCGSLEWSGNHPSHSSQVRSKLSREPRVETERKGRHSLTTNWTKQSWSKPLPGLIGLYQKSERGGGRSLHS